MYDALYIHVPFCKNICDYCALYSVVSKDEQVRRDYLELLTSQLKFHKAELSNISTIYIGGGTPTQLSADELSCLLDAIVENVNVEQLEEWTVEGNPGSCTRDKLELLFAAGVNRLSFGAQSTSRETKKQLGRRSSLSQLEKTLSLARDVGFNNLSLDLIYAIPGQTMEFWEEDLRRVLSYEPEHFSAYSLILEEGTPLSKRIKSVDDDLAVEMYDFAAELADEFNFKRYEVSNYSRPGKHCRHNNNIWHGGTYLGLGPAAVSYDGRQRWSQIRDIDAWLKGAESIVDTTDEATHVAEAVGFGLRTVTGWTRKRLTECFRQDQLELFEEKFLTLEAMGWVDLSDEKVVPTAEGMLFADGILECLLP